MTRKKSLLSLLGAAALTVSLAACGGDDAGSDDNGDAAGNSASSDDGNNDDNDDAGDNASAAGGDYCSQVEAMGSALISAPDPTDEDATVDAAAEFQAIADIAPGDVKDDWQAMADAFHALADIDYTDPDSIAALEGLEDLEANTDRISDHLMSEC